MSMNRMLHVILYLTMVFMAFLILSESTLYYDANKRSWLTKGKTNQRFNASFPTAYRFEYEALEMMKRNRNNNQLNNNLNNHHNTHKAITHLSHLSDPSYPPSVAVVECCPSLYDYVQPLGGVSRDGQVLEMFQGNNLTQTFYQTSCADGVKGRQCRYLQPHIKPFSRCVQRYSYVYAVVREYEQEWKPWRLDFIRIRTGCSCEIRKARKSPSTENSLSLNND